VKYNDNIIVEMNRPNSAAQRLMIYDDSAEESQIKNSSIRHQLWHVQKDVERFAALKLRIKYFWNSTRSHKGISLLKHTPTMSGL